MPTQRKILKRGIFVEIQLSCTLVLLNFLLIEREQKSTIWFFHLSASVIGTLHDCDGQATGKAFQAGVKIELQGII